MVQLSEIRTDKGARASRAHQNSRNLRAGRARSKSKRSPSSGQFAVAHVMISESSLKRTELGLRADHSSSERWLVSFMGNIKARPMSP
jgi:hypothetical protein